MTTPHNFDSFPDREAYIQWLSELDPDDIVNELSINSEDLVKALMEYIDDKYDFIPSEDNSG